MKKRILICLLVSIFSFSTFAVKGEIVGFKGKVEIKKASRWVKPGKGDWLVSGDMVSTGFNSEMTLRIDGSVIIVRPLTRLKIDDIAEKNNAISSAVFINVGSIKANIKPASTKKVEFKVKTPVATASVRGTSGMITADGELVGSSGTWSYRNNSGEEAYVEPGFIVNIDNQGIIRSAQNNLVLKTGENSIKSMAENNKNIPTVVSLTNEIISDFIDAESLKENIIISFANIGWED